MIIQLSEASQTEYKKGEREGCCIYKLYSTMYKINVHVIHKNKYQSIWIEILQSVKFSKQENLTVQILRFTSNNVIILDITLTNHGLLCII